MKRLQEVPMAHLLMSSRERKDKNLLLAGDGGSAAQISYERKHLQLDQDTGDWETVEGDRSVFVQEHLVVPNSPFSAADSSTKSSKVTHCSISIGNAHDSITIENSPSPEELPANHRDTMDITEDPLVENATTKFKNPIYSLEADSSDRLRIDKPKRKLKRRKRPSLDAKEGDTLLLKPFDDLSSFSALFPRTQRSKKESSSNTSLDVPEVLSMKHEFEIDENLYFGNEKRPVDIFPSQHKIMMFPLSSESLAFVKEEELDDIQNREDSASDVAALFTGVSPHRNIIRAHIPVSIPKSAKSPFPSPFTSPAAPSLGAGSESETKHANLPTRTVRPQKTTNASHISSLIPSLGAIQEGNETKSLTIAQKRSGSSSEEYEAVEESSGFDSTTESFSYSSPMREGLQTLDYDSQNDSISYGLFSSVEAPAVDMLTEKMEEKREILSSASTSFSCDGMSEEGEAPSPVPPFSDVVSLSEGEEEEWDSDYGVAGLFELGKRPMYSIKAPVTKQAKYKFGQVVHMIESSEGEEMSETEDSSQAGYSGLSNEEEAVILLDSSEEEGEVIAPIAKQDKKTAKEPEEEKEESSISGDYQRMQQFVIDYETMLQHWKIHTIKVGTFIREECKLHTCSDVKILDETLLELGCAEPTYTKLSDILRLLIYLVIKLIRIRLQNAKQQEQGQIVRIRIQEYQSEISVLQQFIATCEKSRAALCFKENAYQTLQMNRELIMKYREREHGPRGISLPLRFGAE